MTGSGYRKRTTILLFSLLLFRFWLGQTFELTGEEAYSWLKGRNLDWGYWDQGALVPWLIRIGTWFFHDTELGVRWLASVIYTATGFVLFYLASRWFSARAAFWTVIGYVVTPLYFWNMMLMTDGTAAIGLMALGMLVFEKTAEEDRWWWWLSSGLVSGLALLISPIHLLWIGGFVGFLAVNPKLRSRLTGAGAALGLLVLLLCLYPMWNWRQEMQTMQMQAVDWTGRWHPPLLFSPKRALHEWFNQLIRLGPLWVIGGAWLLSRKQPDILADRRLRLLLAISVPGLIIEMLISLVGIESRHVWPVLWLPLLLVAGGLAERWLGTHRWGRWAAAILAGLSLFQASLGLCPHPGFRWVHSGLYQNFSWHGLGEAVVRWQRDTGANLLIADSPATASTLSFYLPDKPFVYVVPSVGVQSQFDLWVGYVDQRGSNALLIARNPEAPDQIKRQFHRVIREPDPQIPGSDDSRWNIFLCSQFGGETEMTP